MTARNPTCSHCGRPLFGHADNHEPDCPATILEAIRASFDPPVPTEHPAAPLQLILDEEGPEALIDAVLTAAKENP